MTTSHYGTTGLLKNNQGQIVSTSVNFKVILVYLALVLDNILLTVVVPIIPIFLYQNEALERNLTIQNSKGILDELIEDSLLGAEKSMETEGLMASENSRIGALFASKAFVQLIFNPLVGKATVTFGYDLPFLIGTAFLLLSSLIFTLVTSFHWLFVARSLQGIASSSIAVAGMGMIANLFEVDQERSKAMGLVLGGIASGVLIGYPLGGILFDFVGETAPFIMMDVAIAVIFLLELKCMWPSRLYWKDEEDMENTTGFFHLFKDTNVLIVSGAILVSTTAMALLEPCLPIWLMDTIHPEKWQIGTVFLPDSLGYLVGTNFFAVPALKFGRYKVAMAALFLVASGCFLIPLATSMWDLVLPHWCLGLGIGVVDSSLMPLLAVLVDEENLNEGSSAAAYGSVYAIAQTAVSLAYGLGPLLGGRLSQTYSFPYVMRALGCLNIAYIPVVFFLKRKRQQQDEDHNIEHVQLKTMQSV